MEGPKPFLRVRRLRDSSYPKRPVSLEHQQVSMDMEEAKEMMLEEKKGVDEYQDTIVVLEMEMVQEDAGIIRGELVIEEEIDTAGSLLIPLSEPKPENWQGMEVGDRKAYGLLVDSKKATLREKISDFFNRSLEEGRMQDFIPGGTVNP